MFSCYFAMLIEFCFLLMRTLIVGFRLDDFKFIAYMT